MLSTVLNSDVAIEVNISIMRAFVTMRNYLSTQESVSKEISDLWAGIRRLEERCEENLKAVNDLSESSDDTFDVIYQALSELAQKHNSNDRGRGEKRPPVGYIKPKELE